MSVLDLARCPICQARNSLVRQTTQLESRTHVTYECRVCGTLLAWLGDEMWLEADRWSFQKVGRPEHAGLLYRSMTVAELRTLAGEKPAALPVSIGKDAGQPKPPPVWIEIPAGRQKAPAQAAAETAVPVEVPPTPEPAAAEPAVPGKAPEPAAGEPAVPVAAGAAVLVEVPPAPEPAAAEPAVPAAAEPAVPARAEPAVTVIVPPAEETPAARELEPEEVAPAAVPAAVPPVPVAPIPVEEERAVRRARKERARKQRVAEAQRRSRGSPFLVISVGLVLLCLICSAAAMVIYSLVGNWPPAGGLPTNPPASEAMPSETPIPTDTPSPTYTPAPTDTPVPTDTPAPTDTPVAAEEPAGVEFQGVTEYQSGTGSRYLVGEVLNRTADTLRFVEVLATFYDASGQVVGTGSTFTELSFIEPGGAAPFKLSALSSAGQGRYELQVAYSTTTQAPIRLELLGHGGALDSDGWYRIAGEIGNPHDFAVKFPEVVATCYNAAHEVVRVEVAFGQVDPLGPGQTTLFEVVVTDPPADLMHYALQTEAAQQ